MNLECCSSTTALAIIVNPLPLAQTEFLASQTEQPCKQSLRQVQAMLTHEEWRWHRSGVENNI